jgi:hypothetical protein
MVAPRGFVTACGVSGDDGGGADLSIDAFKYGLHNWLLMTR